MSKMFQLRLDTLRRAAGLTPVQFAAIIAPHVQRGEDRPDVMLMGKVPAVGSVDVLPRYVSGVAIDPRYPGRGRVGAPAEMIGGQVGAGDPVKYSPQEYYAGDVTWFGLGQHNVGAGAQISFTVQPKRPFKPQQLYCPSTVQGLLLHQAAIGGTNIFANQAGLPIELLSEVSNVPEIDWPTIDPAVGIEFTVGNPTGAPLVFSGGMYGTQVRN